MTIEENKELLNAFLDRWPLQKIKSMKIGEYVGVGNKDTFCQWVETKTRALGSIKGLPGSIKFGIYERKDKSKIPKNYKSDDKYSWLKGYDYNDNYEIAFENARLDIIRIIELSYMGNFREIDNIMLPDMFKWKIAFLYSNERLIPIYKREVLFKIANFYGFATSKETTISVIQDLMVSIKPVELSVYEFMWKLYRQFGIEHLEENTNNSQLRKPRKNRKGTKIRNTNPQRRSAPQSYIAEQKHNKIQEALKLLLVNEFGEENVILEENFVDVKLFQPDYICFYEVKSSSYASECVRQALGQLLLYSLNDTDDRIKKHIVVGQYPPTENDKKYINFIQSNLRLEITYMNVKIDNGM